MGILSRRRKGGERNSPIAEGDDLTSEQLLALVDELTQRNRKRPEIELERRILGLRHKAALRLIDEAGDEPDYPSSDVEVRIGDSGLPEVDAAEVSPELLRAAMLGHGCLLIRNLLKSDEAEDLRSEIDRAFAAREQPSGSPEEEAYWSYFQAEPRFDLSDRAWIGGRSNFWGVDSPRVMVGLFETFERTGLRSLAERYLGERPAVSVNKCTLRRVYPDDFHEEGSSAWHQDGSFLGAVRALNVWLSLSRAGDLSPGLDIVPRRMDRIVETGTEGAAHPWSVSQDVADRSATEGGVDVVRPIFEPGDALLFDEMCLHATAASPDMPNVRYAVECWFFGPSAFPAEYAPLSS